MIFVRAMVKVKPGMLAAALDVYRDFVPKVLSGEPGCLEYAPTVDVDIGLPNQVLVRDLISVFERWKTVEDFKAHIEMMHSYEFRRRIQDFLAERISITVSHSVI